MELCWCCHRCVQWIDLSRYSSEQRRGREIIGVETSECIDGIRSPSRRSSCRGPIDCSNAIHCLFLGSAGWSSLWSCLHSEYLHSRSSQRHVSRSIEEWSPLHLLDVHGYSAHVYRLLCSLHRREEKSSLRSRTEYSSWLHLRSDVGHRPSRFPSGQ